MAKSTKKSQVAAETKENANNVNPEVEQPMVQQTEPEAQEPTEPAEVPTDETPEQKAARLIREEQLKEAKTYIGHKAMYVPAEDYEFHPAIVVGAVIDSKGNVLVALRTDEGGKRVTKKFGSKLLRVLDEMAERPVRSRAKQERPDITDEVIQQHRDLVGYPCELDELTGRVRGVQIDKRTKQIYLTILMDDGSKRHTKITNESFKPMEADDETATIREAYVALLNQRAMGAKSTAEKQVISFGAGFVKAYNQLVADGKIEETENLVAIIEDIVATVKAMPATEQPASEEEGND